MDLWYACINWNPASSKLKSILMIAGGPLASLFTFIFFYLILTNLELPILIMKIFNAIAIFSLFQFISTILPLKSNDNSVYSGFTSDGYKILEWLKIKSSNKKST